MSRIHNHHHLLALIDKMNFTEYSMLLGKETAKESG